MSPETLQTLLDSVQRNEQTRRGMYSIGLFNIYDRLSFLYQEAFTLTIKSEEDQGTIVTICLPTERM